MKFKTRDHSDNSLDEGGKVPMVTARRRRCYTEGLWVVWFTSVTPRINVFDFMFSYFWHLKEEIPSFHDLICRGLSTYILTFTLIITVLYSVKDPDGHFRDVAVELIHLCDLFLLVTIFS